MSHAARTACHFSIALVVVTILGACQARRPVSDEPGGAVPAVRTSPPPAARVAARPPDLQLEPPVLVADSVRPLQGEDLARASATLEQILERLPLPESLSASPQVPVTDEVNLKALKDYIAGRSLFLHQQYREAAIRLEEARRSDPRSPQILRLLGMAYLAQPNVPKAVQVLTQAVQIDSGDVESLFLLGSAAYRRRAWEEAIAILGRVDVSSRPVDSALAQLRPYYLGQALLQGGHLAAAVEQLSEFLVTPVRFGQVTRLYAEVALLQRQRGRIEQEVGDLLCRLGRFEEAMGVYKSASDDEDVNPDALAARLVYASLATHRPQRAEQVLLDHLAAGGASEAAMALVSYLAEHGGDREALIRRLRDHYERAGRPTAMAVALAELLGGDAGAALLVEHLRADSGDLGALRAVVRQFVPDRAPQLVALIVELIGDRPAAGPGYLQILFDANPPLEAVLAGADTLPEPVRNSAAAHYLRGATLEQMGRSALAAEAYDRAVAAEGTFLAPRFAQIDLQLRLRRPDRALELLDVVRDSGDPRVPVIEAQIHAALGRPEDALRLLDQLIQREPRNVDYRLEKARLERVARRYEDAERTLWLVLDLDRTNERAFDELFRLMDARDNPRADSARWFLLLQRAMRTIPSSHVTRYWTAEYEWRRQRVAQAEEILRDLLRDEPGHDEALLLLTRIYHVSGRPDAAVDLLLEHSRQRPQDPWPVGLLSSLLTGDEEGRYAPFIARVAQALSSEPLTLVRVGPAADFYTRQQKFDDAAAVYTRALERFPDAAAALYVGRSIVHEWRGDKAAAEQDLVRALERDPDHVTANNNLGYLWAEQGRNLERALELARKAVEAAPTSGSFRDSLGWVYYKLGDFAAAAEHLRQAVQLEEGTNPVILDHLGDALWRLGEKEEARQHWQQAQRGLAQPRAREDLESARVREAVDAKLKALEQNAEPPVAAVGH